MGKRRVSSDSEDDERPHSSPKRAKKNELNSSQTARDEEEQVPLAVEEADEKTEEEFEAIYSDQVRASIEAKNKVAGVRLL